MSRDLPGPHGHRRPTTTFQPQGDFSVILTGTGCPAYNPNRAGPSALVHHKGDYALVDMGTGTRDRLRELGLALHDIGTMIFTHHHLDHNEEYIPLAVNAWLQGRRYVHLVGPPKTKDLHDFLVSFYERDLKYRAKLTKSSPDGMFANVDITVLEGDNTLAINDVEIVTTAVPHTVYTLAYRFNADGKSIVVSGDLSYSENLVRLARDADVLVMDSGGVIKKVPAGGRPMRPPPPIEMNGQTVRAHSTLEEVATMAAKANVKKMALTHFTPGEVDTEATQREMGKIYGGEIIFGQDLMEVTP